MLLFRMTRYIFFPVKDFLSDLSLFLFNYIILNHGNLPIYPEISVSSSVMIIILQQKDYLSSKVPFSSFCIIFGKFILRYSSFSYRKQEYLPSWRTHTHSPRGVTEEPYAHLLHLSCATRAYLSFADDKERVPSCTLSDDIFPIFIVGLKIKKAAEKKHQERNNLPNSSTFPNIGSQGKNLSSWSFIKAWNPSWFKNEQLMNIITTKK